MDKLKKYLARKDVNQYEFAEEIDCHPSTVTRLLNGGIPDPKISLAIAIEKATGGYVRCQDWAK